LKDAVKRGTFVRSKSETFVDGANLASKIQCSTRGPPKLILSFKEFLIFTPCFPDFKTSVKNSSVMLGSSCTEEGAKVVPTVTS